MSRKKASGLIVKLKNKYPKIKILETNGYLESLSKVSNGEVYYTIATLPVASHYISEFNIKNLHIAGYTNMKYNLSIAIRDDKSILKSILNKALKNISKDTSNSIENKWINNNIKETTDYRYLLNVIIVVFIVALFILYRQSTLNNQNRILEELVTKKTKELQDINENLEQRIIIEVDKNKKKEQQLHQASKMVQIGELIGNIAHQWRQPLSIISTVTSGMQLEKEYNFLTDEKFNHNCELILSKSEYLSNTIETFRNMMEESPDFKKVVLQDRINMALEIIEPILKSNHIELINNIDYSNEIKLMIVIGELSEVVLNIINNAQDIIIENKIEDPWINISLEKHETTALITIEDNAGGIAPENISKIFDPYFTTKYNSQGTGMGLNICYRIIVNKLNGKLYVKNTKNGAKFFIELPIKKED